MSTKIEQVLVAGVNGTLGQAVVPALQKANFGLTLLTTNATKTLASFPGINAMQLDYSSVSSIATKITSLPTSPASTGLVILIKRDQPDPHIALLDAAAEAGIAHVIPSSFGYGMPDDQYLRGLPPMDHKYRMEDHVAALGAAAEISWTCIQNGAFLDWALDRGLFANFKGLDTPFSPKGATMLFDDGNAKISATMLDDVGKAVVGVLKDPATFRNQYVQIHSATITQNLLLEYARELAPEREFPVVDVDTAQLEQTAWARFDAGERGLDVMAMFLVRPYALGLGAFESVANEKFGIKKFGENDLRALVAKYVKS